MTTASVPVITDNRGHRASGRSLPLPLQAILSQIASLARTIALSAIYTPGWSRSVLLLPETGLLGDVVPQVLQVASCPCRTTMPGELVRLKAQRADRISGLYEYARVLITQEVEPFIIGVGQVRARQTAEGIVILRVDVGFKEDRHAVSLPDDVAISG